MNDVTNRLGRTVVLLGATMAVAACGGGGGGGNKGNVKPAFVVGDIAVTHYDGVSDDLLTAGLGRTGLMAAVPAFVDAANPTPAELRRNAIHTNYRALVDFTAAGGFGSLYGPNIDPAGNDTLGEGKIAGTEYIALADDGTGRRNVTLMVQVPDSFDKNNACIVTASSSGSRGIYGAIGTAGEWGLKRGCAVAYTDKGTGNGLHDLAADRVNRIDGPLVPAAEAGNRAIFRAELSDGELLTFNTVFPGRVAYKHAHSQQNPEKDWGRDTLDAIRLAFYVLNEQFAESRPDGRKRKEITPDNTVVIASSVSNGGGAALAAAEQDEDGLIDGVAVGEPQVQPRDNDALTIRQGATTVATHSRPLVDYFTFAAVYQPCALLAEDAGLSLAAAFWPEAYTTAAQNRCAALRARGLVNGDTLAEQANDALARMHAYGWQPELDFLQQSHFRFATLSIALTYVNSYGRFSVTDNVCGFSFANTDVAGNVVAQNPLLAASIFSTGNGIPPTSGVNIVYNDAVGGPTLDFLAISPTSGTADFALDGVLCLRALATGRDEVTGEPLAGQMKAWSDRVQAGVGEVLLGARLRGKPTVIVAGRNDTLVPPNHASRAYYGKNKIVEGNGSPVRYYEVTNAQHFDTFISFGALLGYDSRYIPLHNYFNQAMDLMYAHLTSGAALPPSQVIHTMPRAGAQPITGANVPPISATPAAGDLITTNGGVLTIPD